MKKSRYDMNKENFDLLRNAKDLLDEGIITNEEFLKLKKDILESKSTISGETNSSSLNNTNNKISKDRKMLQVVNLK